MVITWELSDTYSFYTDAARRKNPSATRLPRPLPFDRDMSKKPLYFAMDRVFKKSRKA
jgi:endo-1,4-beta-xylanase